jgi:uncharacterized protein (TIGR03790 family)
VHVLRKNIYPLLTVSLVLGFGALQVSAGGGPQNVLVVVNEQSLDSLAIGQAYQDTRGIHPRQLFAISVTPTVENLSATYNILLADFTNLVQNPILDYLQSSGLSGQVDHIVFSKDIPYLVNNTNSITAAMYYGYQPSPSLQIQPFTYNSYYQAERAFSGAFFTNRYYLSSMLTGWTRSEAADLVARAAASDYTAPTGTFYLVKTSDPLRNQRYRFFDHVEFQFSLHPGMPGVTRVAANSISNRTDVMGYTTGLTSVPDLESNTFRYGATADHLTSFGGRLFESPQMSILDFIKAGVVMTHGTVIEPYAYTQKFPHPMQHFWAARGFSLGESMWMSLANPYNGLVVGDPLAAPWARPAAVSITNLVDNQVVNGLVSIEATALAAASSTVSRLDVYVDDLFLCTMTNLAPEPGNVVMATIDGSAASYTVQTLDSLEDTARGLAQSIVSSNLAVTALVFGDRLQLMSTNDGFSGSTITCSASSMTGSASRLTVFAETLQTTLIDSTFAARELVVLNSNGPDPGNQIQTVITLDGGPVVTNTATAGVGDTVASIMTNLMGQINSDPQLAGTNGVFATDRISAGSTEFWLEARRPGPEGYRIHVDYDVINSAWPTSGLDPTTSFADQFNDNLADIRARASLMLSEGAPFLSASCLWDTTNWPNGSHDLHVVAYEGSAIRVQGHASVSIVVSNSSLACTMVSPTNTQPVVYGATNLVQASVSGAAGSVTQVIFYAEGKSMATLTSPPWEASWSTLLLGPGIQEFRARAWDSTGLSAMSDGVEIQVITNADADFDAMDDDWERQYLGSVFADDGTGNPDNDPHTTLEEFIADTSPADGSNWFHILELSESGTNRSLRFVSSTNRLFQVDVHDGPLSSNSVWLSSGGAFTGAPGEHIWLDSGTTNLPPPSTVTQRYYRVKVSTP